MLPFASTGLKANNVLLYLSGRWNVHETAKWCFVNACTGAGHFCLILYWLVCFVGWRWPTSLVYLPLIFSTLAFDYTSSLYVFIFCHFLLHFAIFHVQLWANVHELQLWEASPGVLALLYTWPFARVSRGACPVARRKSHASFLT